MKHAVRSVLIPVVLAAALSCGQNAPGAVGRNSFPGRDLVSAGRYEEAVTVLARSFADEPDAAHASRVGLFLGKAHLALGHVGEARDAFQATIRRYPDSLEAHKSRYKLALIDLIEGDEPGALESFRAMSERPDGPLAAEATAMTRYLAEREKR